jgi:serine/threonine protein kinase
VLQWAVFKRKFNLRAGAAEYAAPEYALGISRDGRADQFSLAVTLYELLTGHYPYGDTLQRRKTAKSISQITLHQCL